MTFRKRSIAKAGNTISGIQVVEKSVVVTRCGASTNWRTLLARPVAGRRGIALK
jgi:hypothetical protein